MLKIYGEPESPKEKACLRYKIELANNIHTRDRMSGPSNSETFESRTFKLSNFRARNSADFRTFHLDAFQTFKLCKLSIFRTPKLANFIPFKLSISETFKPSNLKTFRSLSVSKPEANLSNSQTFSHKPNFRILSQPFELQTFKLSNFRSLKPSNLRKCKLSKSQTLKLRRPIELDRGKSFKFEFEAASRARKFES